MTTSGIIRRIDELGRIVIPKEIRKSLRIKNGDNLEVFVDDDMICLRKYSQVENLENIANLYAESFNQVLKYNIIITDTDKIVAIAGNLKKKYLNLEISSEISRIIERRECNVVHKKSKISLVNDIVEEGYYAYAPIINNGDSIGAVIILSNVNPMLEQEEKLALILANMLSNYFV